MKLYTGCSGWSYNAWEERFYPKSHGSPKYLEYYSKIFDFAEIDSTFYGMPSRFMSIRWQTLTPDKFKFTAKLPRVITHEKLLEDVSGELKQFFEIMAALKGKLLALLIQLPPSIPAKEGIPKLEQVIPQLSADYRYALEVRHKSWFNPDVYKFLSKNNICLTWSQLDTIQTPPVLTTDFIYLRFIGDRVGEESDLAKTQKEREREMKKWSESVINVADSVTFGFVAANNHYTGFAPDTVNLFRKQMDLPKLSWQEMKNGK